MFAKHLKQVQVLRPAYLTTTVRGLSQNSRQTGWNSWATAGPGPNVHPDKSMSAGQQAQHEKEKFMEREYAAQATEGHVGDWFEDVPASLDEKEPFLEALSDAEMRSTDAGHAGALFEDTGGEVPIAGSGKE